MNVSKNELHAGIETIRAIAEAIRELKRVPAGKLYAVVMGKLELPAFNKVIDILKGAGLVREEAHELIWIDPAGKAAL